MSANITPITPAHPEHKHRAPSADDRDWLREDASVDLAVEILWRYFPEALDLHGLQHWAEVALYLNAPNLLADKVIENIEGKNEDSDAIRNGSAE